MALAPALLPNFQYEIKQGFDEGTIVTIVDNTPFPDCQDVYNTPKNEVSAHKAGLPHHCTDQEGKARKITVRFPDGSIGFVLPRMIADKPVGIDTNAVDNFVAEQTGQPVPAPQPALTVTDSPTSMAVRPADAPITDPMDPRLDHLRPKASKFRRYIKRTMPNGMTDVEYLLTYTNDFYRSKNDLRPANVMLKGNTQSGKTFLVEMLAVAWSVKMGYPKPMPVFTLSGSNGVTDFDMFGQVTSYTDPATGTESLVWLPGTVALAAQCGGILYLDEINAIPDRVLISLNPLADHRHMFVNRNKPVFRHGQFMAEVVEAHPDLWIVGTYNEGYRGMGEMNEAFLNRFRHIRWDYNEKVEKTLVRSPAVLLLGEALRTARAANQRGLRTPVGTTALQHLEEDIESFGIEMGLDTFVSMFKEAEADVVREIIDGRSIRALLEQEKMASEAESPF